MKDKNVKEIITEYRNTLRNLYENRVNLNFNKNKKEISIDINTYNDMIEHLLALKVVNVLINRKIRFNMKYAIDFYKITIDYSINDNLNEKTLFEVLESFE